MFYSGADDQTTDWIQTQISELLQDNATSMYTFPSSLTGKDRKLVHEVIYNNIISIHYDIGLTSTWYHNDIGQHDGTSGNVSCLPQPL